MSMGWRERGFQDHVRGFEATFPTRSFDHQGHLKGGMIVGHGWRSRPSRRYKPVPIDPECGPIHARRKNREQEQPARAGGKNTKEVNES